MILYIKNMVCVRCKMAVQTVLEKLDIQFAEIELGRVKLASLITPEKTGELKTALGYYELDLIDNKKMIITERIKTLIIEMVNAEDTVAPLKFTAYLSKALNYDYTYLSNIYSETEGSTIERFFIQTRINRVKTLIMYEQLNLKEIAFRLNYSSVSHLCLQFKKVTGDTPSGFKRQFFSPACVRDN